MEQKVTVDTCRQLEGNWSCESATFCITQVDFKKAQV